MSTWKRAGVSLVAAAVMAGVAGCQAGDAKPAADAPKAENQSGASVTQALTAAYKKTAAAESAKVHMTMKMPAGVEGGGTMEMSGTLGWNPTVMDMTMKGEALRATPDAPSQVRAVMLDNVIYMDMGAAAGKEMDGKHWLKMDLTAIAKASGNEAQLGQMTGGLENANQDPAKQLAMLLSSPNLKHLGAQKIGGVETEHYKGSLAIEEALKTNKSLDVLSDKDRQSLLDNMKKSGVKGYDTEVWVNKDGYPVRMNIGVDSPQGKVAVTADYSDYGAKAAVKAPPAGETVDFMAMMKELGAPTGSATGSTNS